MLKTWTTSNNQCNPFIPPKGVCITVKTVAGWWFLIFLLLCDIRKKKVTWPQLIRNRQRASLHKREAIIQNVRLGGQSQLGYDVEEV